MQQFHLELDNWSSISVKEMILCFLLHAGEEEKNRERAKEKQSTSMLLCPCVAFKGMLLGCVPHSQLIYTISIIVCRIYLHTSTQYDNTKREREREQVEWDYGWECCVYRNCTSLIFSTLKCSICDNANYWCCCTCVGVCMCVNAKICRSVVDFCISLDCAEWPKLPCF